MSRHKRDRNRRWVVLGLVVFAACADSVGTPSIEDEGDSGSPPRTDAGKRDGTSADGQTDAPDEIEAGLLDAGKKDTGAKDAAADAPGDAPIVDTGTDVNPPTDGGGDANVFTDAGPPSTTLVINELDYDQPGTDGPEFIELLNKSAGDIALANFELIFFNGGASGVSSAYLTQPLGSGTLGAGQYLLVKAASLDAGGAGSVTLTGAIQNGPRDSVVVRDKNADKIVDAVTYGPSGAPVTSVNYTIVEGFASTAIDSNTIEGSIIRDPNGTDTNDNSADFKFTKTPTPGAANVLSL